MGFIGVLVGAGIATGTTMYFASRAERDQRLAVAHSVFFKVLKMCDVAVKVARHVSEEWKEDRNGWHWPALMPLAGIPPLDDTFTAEEMALFARAKGPVFSERLLVASNHSHLILELLRNYNSDRRALGDTFAEMGLVEMDGPIGRIIVDKESDTHRLLAPKIREVETGAIHLREAALKARDHITKLGDDIGPKLKEVLKDDRFKLNMGSKPD
ncbi:hypothetical protein [Vitreimonas flagellata]|uniref:hypothetical protein n=1 Tax=Vitreimonas flagellata TaxID=2560861 RepID=UPI0010752379|nr:hypothetical protein [Vitreimonas flagellata]